MTVGHTVAAVVALACVAHASSSDQPRSAADVDGSSGVSIPTKVFTWQQYGGDAAHASNSHLANAFPGEWGCCGVHPAALYPSQTMADGVFSVYR